MRARLQLPQGRVAAWFQLTPKWQLSQIEIEREANYSVAPDHRLGDLFGYCTGKERAATRQTTRPTLDTLAVAMTGLSDH